MIVSSKRKSEHVATFLFRCFLFMMFNVLYCCWISQTKRLFNLQPRAFLNFPIGELKLEEEQREWGPALSVNGFIGTKLLNGLVLAEYRDEELNLKYKYKVQFLYIIWSHKIFVTHLLIVVSLLKLLFRMKNWLLPHQYCYLLGHYLLFSSANLIKPINWGCYSPFPFYIISFKVACFLMSFSWPNMWPELFECISC